jgi:hypothetical protein
MKSFSSLCWHQYSFSKLRAYRKTKSSPAAMWVSDVHYHLLNLNLVPIQSYCVIITAALAILPQCTFDHQHFEAQARATCRVTHTRVQPVPVYSHMYYNVDNLNAGLGCRENFTEQPSIWCCHLETWYCTILKKKKGKKKNQAQSAVYSHVVCGLCCRCVIPTVLP